MEQDFRRKKSYSFKGLRGFSVGLLFLLWLFLIFLLRHSSSHTSSALIQKKNVEVATPDHLQVATAVVPFGADLLPPPPTFAPETFFAPPHMAPEQPQLLTEEQHLAQLNEMDEAEQLAHLHKAIQLSKLQEQQHRQSLKEIHEQERALAKEALDPDFVNELEEQTEKPELAAHGVGLEQKDIEDDGKPGPEDEELDLRLGGAEAEAEQLEAEVAAEIKAADNQLQQEQAAEQVESSQIFQEAKLFQASSSRRGSIGSQNSTARGNRTSKRPN
mmetsp:Transcript_30783/g.60053  ORF Transcript_30783/g.60053 Transcript_30783/m.60053 type:complete len:273 (-) Transcript_30783:157-975(-)